jgi:hypothetical protein
MTAMMLGFEEMIVRCVDEEAKVHIREAMRCYEAGAYRASIVSTHVAVCFDLIAKLRSLASGGDQDAIALVTKLDGFQQQQRQGNLQAIKGLLEIERTLLDEFRDKFDFFGHQEFEELSRLRSDRNQCAHPTFSHDALPYAPAAELARLHIRSALTYVLSQQPKQGKAALASLQAIVVSPYFPTVLGEAVLRLHGAEIGTARDSLVRAFVDDLAFGWPDLAHPYHANPNVLVAIEATVELHRPIVVPRLVIAIGKLAKSGIAEAVRFAGALALRIREAGEQVDDATKAVLRIWLVQEQSDNKGNAIKRALQIAWWRDAALEALETLTAKQLGGVTDPPTEMVTRAAHLYATATNWGDANELAADVANPLADRFAPADIAYVFEKAHQGADLIGSHGFREFTRLLYDKNPIPDPELEALFDEHNLEHYKRVEQVEEA